MLLQVRTEVKHCLPQPQSAGMQVVRHGRRKLLLQQRLRLPLPQPGLHHDFTHLGKGDEESHGRLRERGHSCPLGWCL